MTKQKQSTKAKDPKSLNSTNGVELETDKLEEAFFDVFDLMNRCVLQNIFLTLGETGRALDEARALSGNGIDVGIEKRYLTKSIKSTMQMFHPESELTDKGMTYSHFGVPVRIKFINNNYKFFKYPEPVFYATEEFKIPNPFNSYYRARFIVR